MRNKAKALWGLLISRTWILVTDKDASLYLDFDRLDIYVQLQSLESLHSNLQETIDVMRKELS